MQYYPLMGQLVLHLEVTVIINLFAYAMIDLARTYIELIKKLVIFITVNITNMTAHTNKAIC